MISLLKKMLLAMLPLTIILLIWQAAALTVLLVRGVAFPTPWETLVRLVNLAGGDRLSNHSLWVHIVSSLQRWLIGFGIAAILGIAYGLMAGRVSWFEKATAKIP